MRFGLVTIIMALVFFPPFLRELSAENGGEDREEPELVLYAEYAPLEETTVDADGNEVRIIRLAGSVHVTYGLIELFADAVIVWVTTLKVEDRTYLKTEIYAEGNVVMSHWKHSFSGDMLYFDVFNARGIVSEGTICITEEKVSGLTLYMRAETLRAATRRGMLIIEADNASLSDCPYSTPHYEFTMTHARIKQKLDIETPAEEAFRETGVPAEPVREDEDAQEISGQGVKIKAGGLTLFYWPKITLKESVKLAKRGLKSVRGGHSSNLGWFIRTDWGARVAKYVDFIIEADYLLDRGPAAGLDLKWPRPNSDELVGKGFGEFDSYYVRDHGEDYSGVPLAARNRGRARWTSRQFLPYDVTCDVQFSYLSDANFLDIYEEKENREGPLQDTYLYLRRVRDNHASYLTWKARLNDFAQQRHYPGDVEYLPKFNYDVNLQNIGKSNFYWATAFEAANVRRRYPEKLGTREIYVLRHDPAAKNRELWRQHFNSYYRDQDAWRADFRNTLFYKHSFGDYLRALPYAGAGASFYDDSVEGGSLDRESLWAGVRLNTQLWNIFDTRLHLLDVDKLRHIIMPEVSYHAIYSTSEDSNRIHFYDDLDAVVESDTVRLSVRNILQTKREVDGDIKTVDLLDVNSRLTYYLDKDNVKDYRGWHRTHEFASLDYRLTFRPREFLSVSSNATYNVKEGYTDIFNVRTDYVDGKRYKIGVGHRYVRDDVSLTSIDYELNLSDKYNIEFFSTRDFEAGEFHESGIIFRRSLHKLMAQLMISYDDRDNEFDFSFFILPWKLTPGDANFFKERSFGETNRRN